MANCMSPATAYGFLERLQVPEGGYLLQSAAGSTIGRQLIALAKHRGVKTINLVRRKEQVQELLDLGCAPPESPRSWSRAPTIKQAALRYGCCTPSIGRAFCTDACLQGQPPCQVNKNMVSMAGSQKWLSARAFMQCQHCAGRMRSSRQARRT